MDLQINFDCLRTQPASFHSGQVVVAETGNNPHQQLILAGRHALLADRSASEGGGDTGPDPQSLLMMALGSQISMALRDSADRNGWVVEQIIVHFDEPRRGRDHQRLLDRHRNECGIACSIELIGELFDWQQSQLIAVANRHLAAWSSIVDLQPTSEITERAAA
jgi:putative redox protein